MNVPLRSLLPHFRQAGIGCLALWLLAGMATAAIKTRTVTYQHGTQKCIGFFAYDDAQTGPRPSVLVFHEWWGLNDYAKGRAESLAKLGYAAFCADMYGDGKNVEHPKDAGEMTTKVRMNVGEWRGRAIAGLEALVAQPECDREQVAAIGYCFGGTSALQLAMTGANLKAVATFHSALPALTADDVAKIKPRILVCHGAEDGFIPQGQIDAFRKPLEAARKPLEFIAYPNAKHSFTVPDAGKHGNPGMQYSKDADEGSWKKLMELLVATIQPAKS